MAAADGAMVEDNSYNLLERSMINKPHYLKHIIQFIFCLFSCAAFANEPKLLMSYWSYHDKSYSLYPVAGSFNTMGFRITNKDMLDKLNYLNMIAYAFLWVDPSGIARFTDSSVDLSYLDNAFCVLNKNICLDRHNLYSPGAGNFSAFSLLQNNTHSLKKIISVGGANSDQSFDNAISNVDNFVNSIEKIVAHYHLNGVDLDFEPDNFTLERMNGYANLLFALRKKLGSDKIIIVTVSADQNINAKSWKKISEQVNYVSDMCYEFHSPFNQPAITGYNSNLYADFNEPLISRYYHISCDQSIKSLTFLGVPPDKIVLGYPSYALAYGGVKNVNYGLFQPFNQKETPVFDFGIKSKRKNSISHCLTAIKIRIYRACFFYKETHERCVGI